MLTAASRLRTRLAHALARTSDEPFGWTAAQLLRGLRNLLLWFLLLPLALALHLAGMRRLPVITQRIGHLAAEVDCFLKERALGQLPRRAWFIAARPRHIANRHLLNYWKNEVKVVDRPILAQLLQVACRPPIAAHDIVDYVLTQHGAAHYGAINAQWGTRRALLALTDEDREWGAAMLAELGLPRGAWFVCIHPRTPGFASHDDKVHAYRNSTPALLLPAVGSIAERGGWSVLMGDASSPPLANHPRLIDYAHHRLRSERLDVVLCALCRFFLGSSSGLFAVSTVFGVRSALTNQVPMAVRPYAPGDLYIPKLYRATADSRVLSFAEALSSPIGGLRHSRQFRDAGIELVENTAEEILDLAEEMLESLAAPAGARGDDGFNRLLEGHHYGFGSKARISARFLARHRHLLQR